jgi:transposase
MFGNGRVRDLPWSVYRATVIVEVHRLRCPECGVLVEKIEQLALQGAVQQTIRGDREHRRAKVRQPVQVARRFQLPETTVRAIDLRCLERWEAAAPQATACAKWAWMRSTGARRVSILTVVCNLKTGEPLWFGRERKKETLGRVLS